MKYLNVTKLFCIFFLVTSGSSAFALRTVGLDYTIVNESPATQTILVGSDPFKSYVYRPYTSESQGPEPYSFPHHQYQVNDSSWIQTGFESPTLEELRKGVILGKKSSLRLGRVEYAYNSNKSHNISYRTSLEFLVKGLNGTPDRSCKLNFHVWIPRYSNDLMVYSYENNEDNYGIHNKAREHWQMYRDNRSNNGEFCKSTLSAKATMTGEVLIKISP